MTLSVNLTEPDEALGTYTLTQGSEGAFGSVVKKPLFAYTVRKTTLLLREFLVDKG
jgi:hypothetical protein